MRPPIRHRLRPHRSVSLLQGIMSTAMINRNSVIVVCTPFTSVCRSWLMSLIITFMFEPAKLQMNWASASGARKARGEPTHFAVPVLSLIGVELTQRRAYVRPHAEASPEADEQSDAPATDNDLSQLTDW